MDRCWLVLCGTRMATVDVHTWASVEGVIAFVLDLTVAVDAEATSRGCSSVALELGGLFGKKLASLQGGKPRAGCTYWWSKNAAAAAGVGDGAIADAVCGRRVAATNAVL